MQEFWNGWFDHWGAHHHTTPAADAAAELDALLAAGASVNLYMFHGGTNFGLTNGANDKGVYQPLVTSYDYDAPLDEAGDPTPKYHAFRDVIARYHKVPDSVPPPARPAPAAHAVLRDPVRLLDAPDRWGTWEFHEELPAFDDLTPMPRLALLRTTVAGDRPGVLAFGEVRDRATVFFDGAPVGTLQRDHHERAIGLPRAHGELLVLVEDQGRVDYGPRIGEAKGIIGGATLHGEPLTGWDVLPVELDALPELRPAAPSLVAGAVAGPVLLRAEVDVDASADLFLDTGEWGKGLVWFNGFPLGRYWRRGPQRTLYVPRPGRPRGRQRPRRARTGHDARPGVSSSSTDDVVAAGPDHRCGHVQRSLRPAAPVAAEQEPVEPDHSLAPPAGVEEQVRRLRDVEPARSSTGPANGPATDVDAAGAAPAARPASSGSTSQPASASPFSWRRR